MTISQLKGMLRFHRSAYRAYRASGQTAQAEQARARMIAVYLEIRKGRK